MPPVEIPRLALRPVEAARSLGLCVKTVRKLIREGRLKAVRVDRAWLVPVDEVQRFLERGTPASTSPVLRSIDEFERRKGGPRETN